MKRERTHSGEKDEAHSHCRARGGAGTRRFEPFGASGEDDKKGDRDARQPQDREEVPQERQGRTEVDEGKGRHGRREEDEGPDQVGEENQGRAEGVRFEDGAAEEAVRKPEAGSTEAGSTEAG